MKIQFIFAWYDLWIGLFYDKKKNWIYACSDCMKKDPLKYIEKAKIKSA